MKKNAAVMLFLAALVTACAGTGFSLPPVAGGSGGERLPGKIVWQDLLTDTPQQTEAFYSGLFGWEFEPLGGGVNYTLIRHRGRLIGGLVDQNALPATADISQWVVAMSVADIEKSVQTVADAGGEVFTPATSLGERGDIAVVADPAGALMALLQTRDGDPVDSANADPATGDFLWRELWTVEVDRAAEFLARLAPFAVESIEIDAADVGQLPAGGRPERTGRYAGKGAWAGRRDPGSGPGQTRRRLCGGDCRPVGSGYCPANLAGGVAGAD